jgi:hypothetical protein
MNTILLGLILIVALVACGLMYMTYQAAQGVQRVTDLPGQTINELQTRIAELQHPTPTVRPSPATIIAKIQAMSRLESVSYTVEKVITAEENQGPFGWLFGDRLLLVAHGEVIAGVDLGKLQPGDIMVTEDNRVYVTLPAAEVLVTTLDNDKTYVYQRDTGVIGGNVNLETIARQAAEDEIRKAALEDGILKLAQSNAENTVRGLLLALGFTDVVFITATPVPPTPQQVPATVVVSP